MCFRFNIARIIDMVNTSYNLKKNKTCDDADSSIPFNTLIMFDRVNVHTLLSRPIMEVFIMCVMRCDSKDHWQIFFKSFFALKPSIFSANTIKNDDDR